MKSESIITIFLKIIINISINYHNILSNDRDFLFEFELSANYYFDLDEDIFAHVVDFSMTFVQTQNVIETLITLFKSIKLNIVIKYAVNECYQVFYKLINLVIYGWRISNRFETIVFTVVIINSVNINHIITNPNLEHMLSIGVIVYDNNEAFYALNFVVTKYKDVFIDSGNIIDISEKQ